MDTQYIKEYMASLTTNNYGLLLIGGIIAFIAFFVLGNKPKSRMHISFFVFALGAALWMCGIGLISLTENFFYDKLVNYGGLAFVFGFFLLARSIPVPTPCRVKPWLFSLPIVIEAIFIIPFDLINKGMMMNESGALVPIPGPFIIPHCILVLGYTILGIIILWCKFRKAADRERLQIKYLFLGTGAFMLSSVIFDAILPAFGNHDYILLGPLSSIIFISLIAYAVVRHELLDIRIIIQRGLIYSCLFILIAACYLLILNTAIFTISNISDTELILIGIVTTVIGIFSVPAIDRILKKATDKIFFKDQYDYAESLHKLSVIVNNSVEFDVLIDRVEKALKEILRTNDVKLIFTETQKEDSSLTTLMIPILVEEQIIGSIYCGKKRSGDKYNNEDRRLIETFAHQAATALGRARLYKEVEDYAEQLETKVTERTKDLYTAQENQRQLMMDISHNLQTPLAVFQTRLEQFKKLLPQESTIPGLEKTLRELSDFIYRLLSLANLEHKSDRAVTVVNLSELLSGICEEIRIIAENKDIRVYTKVEYGIEVRGNMKELREALLNVLSNAVKYMKPEGVREIHITLTKTEECAVISVKDTGIGIPLSHQSKVFERFYRVDSNSFGTGLGLAITDQIIKEHKGEISLESKEGIGSTFYLKLPL